MENGRNKRPDLILFVNGLPLVVIELKNAADEMLHFKVLSGKLKLIKGHSFFVYLQ